MVHQPTRETQQGPPSRGERGQASILVAIIFQVLFIFFAMVINVGMLVHDKINLQNSVDIAAYYGAMKQAEVLNAMGQVNFQIRQSWKLFAWRLWSLGNVGLIAALNTPNGAGNVADKLVVFRNPSVVGPVVCVANALWWEDHQHGSVDNLCKGSFTVPVPNPVKLSPAQLFPAFSSVLGTYVAQSRQNYNLFTADFGSSGNNGYGLALTILGNYKATVAKKRAAMQALQNLLIGQTFQDLSGGSVSATVQNVLTKNLTLPNKSSLSNFQFTNSLTNQPFLVPIDVRAFVRYEDLVGTSGTGTVKDIITPPSSGNNIPTSYASLFYNPDYYESEPDPSAQEFVGETDALHNMDSLVGFEKNPWVLAYVSVSATTSPKMLFSPFTQGEGGVKMTAQAYAMPFGGRIGPWYYDTWPAGAASSQGQTKIDNLLPPRMSDPGYTGSNYNAFPNYSRFPGDGLGMQSELADDILISSVYNAATNVLPHYSDNDYANLSTVPDDPNLDPIVYTTGNPTSTIRKLEIAAVAPNLFDAVYYPVQANFDSDFGLPTVGGTNMYQTLCQNGCYDMGSAFAQPPVQPMQVVDQITAATSSYHGQGFWIITDPSHLNLGWTQEATNDYGANHPPTKMGTTVQSGGRVGYSVKLVSQHFLQQALPLGGQGTSGNIVNPPQ